MPLGVDAANKSIFQKVSYQKATTDFLLSDMLGCLRHLPWKFIQGKLLFHSLNNRCRNLTMLRLNY